MHQECTTVAAKNKLAPVANSSSNLQQKRSTRVIRQHNHLSVVCSDERQWKIISIQNSLAKYWKFVLKSKITTFRLNETQRLFSNNCQNSSYKQTPYRFSSSTTPAYPALSPTKSWEKKHPAQINACYTHSQTTAQLGEQPLRVILIRKSIPR